MLVLEQKHYLGGRQKLFLSNNSMRLEHENSGIVVLSRAPYKDMVVLNSAKHNYVTKTVALALKQLYRKTALLRADDILSEEPWDKGVPTPLGESKAVLYSRHSPQQSWYKAWVLQEPKMPAPIVQLMCEIASSIPPTPGVPLKCEQYHSLRDERQDDYETLPRKSVVVFQTLSAKTVSVPDSLFETPKNYVCVNGTNKALPDTARERYRKAAMKSPDFMFQSSRKVLHPNSPNQGKQLHKLEAPNRQTR
ncbi:hypothetical protein BH11CYA1_BH11CYA1_43590 [soil metagenome]